MVCGMYAIHTSAVVLKSHIFIWYNTLTTKIVLAACKMGDECSSVKLCFLFHFSIRSKSLFFTQFDRCLCIILSLETLSSSSSTADASKDNERLSTKCSSPLAEQSVCTFSPKGIYPFFSFFL